MRSFGWAIFDTDAKPELRLVDSGHEGTFATTVPIARFMHFRAMVRHLISKYGISAVGIESPAYSGGPFSEIHFGLMLYSLEAIFEARLDCVLFDPSTVKYLARVDPKNNKKKMDKIDMQKYVAADTLNPTFIDNNEADAYIVAKFCSRMIQTADGLIDPKNLTPAEYSVFIGRTKTIKRSGSKLIKRTAHIFRENSRHYRFSNVPFGDVNLPVKNNINPVLLNFLAEEEKNAEEALKFKRKR